jgi:Na+/melibiose symporter-like transporter
MGLVVRNLLGCSHLENRVKYALLFLGAALLMSVGFVGLASVRERPARKHEQAAAKRTVLMLAGNIILSDKRLRLYLCAFLLSGAPAMALPFIVLFARERLSFNAADVGIFLAIQMTGSLSVALLWGKITDKYGCKVTAALSSSLSILFLAAATMPLLSPCIPRTILYVVYGFIGVWTPGRQVCFDKMLLRMSSEKMRPIYIALKGTFSFPLVLYPLAGAFLLRWTHSYSLLLIITTVLAVAGCAFSFSLPSGAQLENKHEV